jgi:hypothetical protein
MIIVPAIIENISTRKDNTLKVVLGTNEITPDKVGQLMSLHNKMAYVAIKAEMFNPDEKAMLSELKADEQIGKTPSQRLRSVLYILYAAKDDGFKTFNEYYIYKMEGFIEHLKTKID